MIIKKTYIEILLQIIFIIAIFLLFFFEKLNLSKIYDIFSFNNLDLIFLIFFNNLAISILFYLTLRVIINKKSNIFKICSTFLEGGIVKLIFPGGDLIYKYIKLKNIGNISFLQYSISQTFLSISFRLCFFLLALILGLVKIFEIKSNIMIIIIISIFIMFFLLYYFKNRIYKFIKIKILSFKKINKILTELSSIKKIIYLKKKNFLNIFLLFFILSIIQSYSFHIAANKFGMEISIINSFFVYISSILLTAFFYFNFIGVFEITLALSASFISQDYFDMVLIGFSLRILNIIAIFFWISFFSIANLIFKKKQYN
jgi:hypothetical protein